MRTRGSMMALILMLVLSLTPPALAQEGTAPGGLLPPETTIPSGLPGSVSPVLSASQAQLLQEIVSGHGLPAGLSGSDLQEISQLPAALVPPAFQPIILALQHLSQNQACRQVAAAVSGAIASSAAFPLNVVQAQGLSVHGFVSGQVVPGRRPPTFGDLVATPWAWQAVDALAAAGVVHGVGPDRFDPQGSLTQQQWVAMLTACLGGESGSGSPVAGVAPWAQAAMQEALAQGWLSAGSGIPLDPQAVVDRYQAVTLLVRALGLGGLSQGLAGQAYPFQSSGPVPDWARGPVTLAAQLGLVHGTGGGSFGGTQPLTRAEAAVLLANAYDLWGQVLQGASSGQTRSSGCNPVLSAFTPASGRPGSAITITGHGFGSTAGQVLFSDPSAPDGWDAAGIQSWSDTQITATVPTTPLDKISAGTATSPAGPTAIEVTLPGGCAATTSQSFLVTNYATYAFVQRPPANPLPPNRPLGQSPSAGALEDQGQSPVVSGGDGSTGSGGSGAFTVSFYLNEAVCGNENQAECAAFGQTEPGGPSGPPDSNSATGGALASFPQPARSLSAAPAAGVDSDSGGYGSANGPEYAPLLPASIEDACGNGYVTGEPWIWGFRILYSTSANDLNSAVHSYNPPAPLAGPQAVPGYPDVFAFDFPAVYTHIDYAELTRDPSAWRRDLAPQSVEVTGLTPGQTYYFGIERIFADSQLPPLYLNRNHVLCDQLPWQVPYPSFQENAQGQLVAFGQAASAALPDIWGVATAVSTAPAASTVTVTAPSNDVAVAPPSRAASPAAVTLAAAVQPGWAAGQVSFTATYSCPPTGCPPGASAGPVSLGAAPVVDGQAVLSWTPADAGQYSDITARYGGWTVSTGGIAGNGGENSVTLVSPGQGSTTATVTVGTAASRTSLLFPARSGTAVVGQPLDLTASVQPLGLAGESVRFTATPCVQAAGKTYCIGSGRLGNIQTLGTATIDRFGEATLAWTPAQTGTFEVNAVYPGDGTVLPSATENGPVVTVVQQAATTTTWLAPEKNQTTNLVSGDLGQTFSLTAAVSPKEDVLQPPAGTVTFAADFCPYQGTSYADCGAQGVADQTIGTVRLGASGVAALNWTPTQSGTYQMWASYGGGPGFTASASTPQVTVDIAASRCTSSSLAASPNPVYAGQSVNLDDKVSLCSSGAAVPGGSDLRVAFSAAGPDGATQQWTTGLQDGEATVQWEPTANDVGDWTITATFTDTAGSYASSQATANLQVEIKVGQHPCGSGSATCD